MIGHFTRGALVVVALAMASPAWAQPRAVGERLIAESGAPERFMLETREQAITIIDSASGLRCSLPPNAAKITLTVSGDLLQCGYSGGIYSNWMVATGAATQVELRRFVVADALFQQQHTHNLWSPSHRRRSMQHCAKYFPTRPNRSAFGSETPRPAPTTSYR